MVYSPVRAYNARNEREYTELHTGDWWWETQDKLPADSTIIPLLLASDKTQLTEHHGDVAAWPVYLTIGNLDIKTRLTPRRPSTLLLGFLPMMARKYNKQKRAMYHEVMGTILERKPLASGISLLIPCKFYAHYDI